jgi:hypothetical protein
MLLSPLVNSISFIAHDVKSALVGSGPCRQYIHGSVPRGCATTCECSLRHQGFVGEYKYGVQVCETMLSLCFRHLIRSTKVLVRSQSTSGAYATVAVSWVLNYDRQNAEVNHLFLSVRIHCSSVKSDTILHWPNLGDREPLQMQLSFLLFD